MLSAELASRIGVAADRIALSLEYDPDDVVALGVELLVAGFDGPAVVKLASFGPRARRDEVEEAAVAAFAEVGVSLPSPGTAGWALARSLAEQLQAGGPETYQRANALWGLWEVLGQPTEIAALVEVMDDWETTLRGQPKRAEVEHELQSLAEPIITRADAATQAEL